jgi:hypothetical protein
MEYTKVAVFTVKRTRCKRTPFHRPYPERPLLLVRGPFPAVAADLGEAPIVFLITM